MSQTIYDTVRPFYYMAKINGFACFSIDGDITQGRIKTKFIDILVFVMYFVLHGANCIIYLIQLLINSKLSQIELLRIKVLFFIQLLTAVFYILATFIQRYKLWAILQHLHIFDENIKDMGYSVDHRKHRLFFWFYVIQLFVCMAYALYLLMVDSSYYDLIFFTYIPNMILFIQIAIIKLSILSVYVRQHDFIKCFTRYLIVRNKNSIFYVKPNNKSHVVMFSKLHEKLNLAVNSINCSFSFILLVCLVVSFSNTVFWIYGFIIFFRENSISFENNILYQIKVSFVPIVCTVYILIIFAASNEITRRV